MTNLTRAVMATREYTDADNPVVLPLSRSRAYLLVQFGSAGGTIAIGKGVGGTASTAELVYGATGSFEPLVAPISELRINVGAGGNVIVVEAN